TSTTNMPLCRPPRSCRMRSSPRTTLLARSPRTSSARARPETPRSSTKSSRSGPTPSGATRSASSCALRRTVHRKLRPPWGPRLPEGGGAAAKKAPTCALWAPPAEGGNGGPPRPRHVGPAAQRRVGRHVVPHVLVGLGKPAAARAVDGIDQVAHPLAE